MSVNHLLTAHGDGWRPGREQIRSSFWSGHSSQRWTKLHLICCKRPWSKQLGVKPEGISRRCWWNRKVVAFTIREKRMWARKREKEEPRRSNRERNEERDSGITFLHLLECEKTQWCYSSSQLHKTVRAKLSNYVSHKVLRPIIPLSHCTIPRVTNCSLVKEIGHFNVRRTGSAGRQA